MNKLRSETRTYATRIKAYLEEAGSLGAQLFVIPPFTSIDVASSVLADTSVIVGAQNAHYEESGAYTGEISVPMARDAGARLIEIGHSERRHLFGESDFDVQKRLAQLLTAA